jgi:cysteine-rich repeat protein
MILKVKKIKVALLLGAILVISSIFMLRAQNGAFSENLPILVNLSHMEFGDVFPGQEVQKTFQVSYSGNGEGKYTIAEKYKPKPDAVVPEGYKGSTSDYCQEYHDDFTRCYRNLCPYIDVKSSENEGDTTDNASVSPSDPQDVWNVFLKTPAIMGKVTQDYAGKFVSETGEYGCDLSFNVGLPSASICGNGKIEAGEECDDGNKIDNDGCSSTCKINKGSISGCKYNDKNGNGKIDDGEGTLSGWEIQLIRCPYSPLATGTSAFNKNSTINTNPIPGMTGYCSVTATTKTGEDGCYSFNNLDAGDYGVNETGKSGWTETSPANDSYYYLNLSTGKEIKNINFLNHLDEIVQPSICGNGKWENGEECDDGNVEDGDGCSSTCKLEKCTESKSVGKAPDKVLLDNGSDATSDVFNKDDGKCAYQAVTSTQYINLQWNFDIPGDVSISNATLKLKHAEEGIDVFLEGWDGSKFVQISEVDESTKNTEDQYDVSSIIAKSGAQNIKFRLRLNNPTKCHECVDWAYLELKYNKFVNCSNTCTLWKYSDWGSCINGQQTRTVLSSLPENCMGGKPILSQSCQPTCSDWTYSDWGSCINGQQTRTVLKSSPCNCTGGSPVTSQSCSTGGGGGGQPTCSSWTYSDWSGCFNGQQTRNVLTSSPSNCVGGNPLTNQSCSSGGGGMVVCNAPITNNSRVFDVTEVGAKFSWLTNYPADSRVICGETSILGAKLKSTPDYGYDFSTQDYDINPKVTSHNLSVFELKPNTRYYCRLVSSTRCGEAMSDELSFTTLPHPEVVAPPTQIQGLYTYNLTSTLPCPVQIGLKWKTNKNATTCVVYSENPKSLGSKPLYGYDAKSAGCNNLSKQSTDHSVVLNLKHCTTYYFRLVATDGTLDAVSDEQQLRTRCDAQSTYFPRSYVAAAATTAAITPRVETGQVQSAAVNKPAAAACPTCEICQKAQDTVKTVVETKRYLSTEDWVILFLILVALILIINALVSRNRRKREESSIGMNSGFFNRSFDAKTDKKEDVISEDNKLD